MPLRSLKQTLFFANEVPGVVVPESVQERMRRAADRGPEHEKAEGLAIARELAAGIAAIARGIHIMPMGRVRASRRRSSQALPASARRRRAPRRPEQTAVRAK